MGVEEGMEGASEMKHKWGKGMKKGIERDI